MLFVPVLDRQLIALNLQTGESLWSTGLDGEPGELLVVGGTVYLGHLRRKEALAGRSPLGELKALGIGGIR